MAIGPQTAKRPESGGRLTPEKRSWLEKLGITGSKKSGDGAATAPLSDDAVVGAMLEDVNRMIAQAMNECPPEVYARLSRVRDEVQAQRKDKPADARRAVKVLAREAMQALSGVVAAKQRWEQTRKDRDTIDQKLKGLEGGRWAEAARPVRSEFVLCVAMAEKNKDYDPAVERLKTVQASLATLEPRLARLAEQEALVKSLRTKALERLDGVNRQLAAATTKLGTGKPPQALADKAAALQREWVGGLAKATDADAAKAQAERGEKQALELLAEIAVLLTPGAQGDKARQAEQASQAETARIAQSRAEFEAVLKDKVRPGLARLENIDGVQATALETRATQLVAELDKTRTPEAWKSLRERLDALAAEVAQGEKGAQGRLDLSLKGVMARYAKVKKLLDEAQARDLKEKSPNALLVAALAQRLARVDQMIRSGNVDVIGAADAALAELEASLGDIEKNWGEFVKMRLGVLALEKSLDDKNLKSVTPTRAEELKKLYPERRDEIMAMDLKPAQAAARELEEKILGAVRDAEWLAGARKEFDTEIEELRAELKKLDPVLQTASKNPKARYDGELTVLLKKVEADRKVESKDGVQTVVKNIKTIRDGIKKYLDKAGGAALVADQGKADAAREATAKAKVQWKRDYAAFRKGLLAQAGKAVKSIARGDVKAYEDLAALAERTDETAAKSENYDAAQQQLQLCRSQAQALIAEPRGARRSARNQVGELSGRWTRSVADFRTRLAAFVATVEKKVAQAQAEAQKALDPKADEAQKKQAKAEIDALGAAAARLHTTILPVQDLFDGHAFDRCVKVIAGDDAAEAEVLAAREEGLRVVRRYQDLIQNDPRVRHLVANPFEGGLVTGLHQALGDLDLNLRRGV